MTDSPNIISNKQSKKESINFLLYSLGLLVSLFGTNVYTFTIGLYVLKVTGSGLSFATTLVLSTIPVVLINPFAGVLADKLNRKILVVSMDLINGILFIGLFLFSKYYGLSLAIIYISTFINNCFTAIFNVSMDSAMPNIVSKNNLMKLNSITKIIISITMILGPMVGGIFFALINIKTFIVINGLSFLLSGITELFIDFQYCKENVIEEKSEKLTFYEEVKEGYKYILGKFDIVMMIAIFIILNFAIGFSIQVPLPFVINDVLKISTKYFGIIQSMLAIGFILGALIINRYGEKWVHYKVIANMCIMIGITTVLMTIPVFPGVSFSSEIILVIYYCFITMILGGSISLIDITATTYLQIIIADNFRGRVMSLQFSLVKIILPLALILSGFAIDFMPIHVVLLFGSFLIFMSVTIWYRKYLRYINLEIINQ
ncbi:MFS transporter [Caloranaerobacter ferrireducens]|uniref:MFS transporter n=1 Tax=Caloranaerobacter ferrireducens TaxID=1323370 RepID=UPI00084D821A|nr:MFS transporter [Caloranaerobacter ferrireducens]